VIRVAIITISDSASAGEREDRSGPALAESIIKLGWQVSETKLISDDFGAIQAAVMEMANSVLVTDVVMGHDVIVTTGGTGVAPRDQTPEATRSIADREIAGFGELMRAEGAKKTKFSYLSRSTAFTLKQTLILNLPGSPRGAVESLETVAHLIPHAVDLLHGRTKH
jgi:molybdopterin adenylyltransferase